MNDDQIFQLILIAGVALVFPIAAYYRARSMTDEKLDRSKEGAVFLGARVILAGPAMLAFLAYLINPEWMAWSAVPLPFWLRCVGVAIGIPTAALLFWTFRTLGKNLTDTVVTRRDATLVTTGPYRWVRHPFYVAFILSVLANTLAMANAFILVLGLAAFVMLALRTRIEEAMLIQRFGDDYRHYMKRTGRFVPRLSERE
jgi:protein-S-isoprenylcysteine O-methyltransferase Ste14